MTQEEKLDHIIAILEERAQNDVIKDNWRDWNSVLEGCSYNGGTLEADYTEQNKWRIKYIKGDFTQTFYPPEHLGADLIATWWVQGQDEFMEHAMLSVEAYEGIQ